MAHVDAEHSLEEIYHDEGTISFREAAGGDASAEVHPVSLQRWTIIASGGHDPFEPSAQQSVGAPSTKRRPSPPPRSR